MSFSAEESSPAAHVSDACFICEDVFDTDLELTNHLIEHASEVFFLNALAEKEKTDKSPTPKKSLFRRRVGPEFISTNFINEINRKSSFKLSSKPGEPELLEILSSDDEQEPDAKKAKTSFRVVPPASNQENSTKKNQEHSTTKNHEQLTNKNHEQLTNKNHEQSSNKSGVPPSHCQACKLMFKDVKEFQEHLTSHHKTRPFVCHICKKSFAYKGTLRQHLHLHISERAHECKLCHKKFSIKSLLRKHEETHDMAQPQEKGNS